MARAALALILLASVVGGGLTSLWMARQYAALTASASLG